LETVQEEPIENMIDGDFTFKEDLRNFPDLENLLDPRQKESKSLNIEIVLI
jgi:hypothetical protein